MSELRDERELTTDLELRIPSWLLPGGRIGMHYKRVWDKRANHLVNYVAQTANVTEDALLKRVEEGDGFADVFQAAGRRMIDNGDPVLCDVLARLIASALQDDTHIHEVSYLLAKLEHLQPIHIRIIVAVPIYPDAVTRQDLLLVSDLAKRIKASAVLVLSALGELQEDRFIKVSSHHPNGTVALLELGLSLRNLIDELR